MKRYRQRERMVAALRILGLFTPLTHKINALRFNSKYTVCLALQKLKEQRLAWM